MTRDTDDFFSDPFEGLHSKRSSSTFSSRQQNSSASDNGFGFPKGFFDHLDSDRDLTSNNNNNSRHSSSTTSSSTMRRNLVEDGGDDNNGIETSSSSSGGKVYTKTVTIGSDVRPEDVKITLKDFVMTVEVKTEKRREDGASASQEFLSKFTIPRNVDKSKITSTWTSEGNLKIEAPLLPEEEKPQEQVQQRRNFFDTDSSTSDFFGTSVQQTNDVVDTTPEKYSVSVPVGKNIDPENLKVSVKDDVLTIEAKVEKKSENLTSHQEFRRKFTLPPNVDSKLLTSTLLSDGCLKIEAPVMSQKKRQ